MAANQKFADAIIEIADPGSRIWVHDYQLMLVPKMVQEKIPGAKIGYFQHIQSILVSLLINAKKAQLPIKP